LLHTAVNKGEKMALYNHLKEYRARIGVNQQELGSMVHVSRQTISLIERGDYSPSVSLALKLAMVFDAKVEDLFEYVDDGKGDPTDD
jgi:putative transcriptional regulator